MIISTTIQKAKSKRQKAKVNRWSFFKKANHLFLPFDLCLLPFRFAANKKGQSTSEMVLILPIFVVIATAMLATVYMSEQALKTQEGAVLAGRMVGQERVAGGIDEPSIQKANGFWFDASGVMKWLSNSSLSATPFKIRASSAAVARATASAIPCTCTLVWATLKILTTAMSMIMATKITMAARGTN